jgi:hypothetical protein
MHVTCGRVCLWVIAGEGRKGWALLRSSLHDPLLVLNIESEIPDGTAVARRKLHDFFLQNAGEVAVDFSQLSLNKRGY